MDTVSNNELDREVVIYLKGQRNPRRRASCPIASTILHRFGPALRQVARYTGVGFELWNAQELVSQACQRLKRSGIAKYDRKNNWHLG